MSAKVKFSYNDGFGTQHTQTPVTTGTSVIGVAFDKGVIIATDNIASYGSLARFRNVQRVARVNDKTIIGCGGDYADYQFLMQHIEQRAIEEAAYEDNHQMSPNSLHTWLTRIQYNKRSNFDPLWCNWVVGGLDHDGKPFLGCVDKLGTAYTCPVIATGFGAYLATPMLREESEKRGGKFSEEDALKVIQKCLQVLYYRDARSWNQYHIAVVNDKGSKVEGPFKLESDWQFATAVTGYE